MRLMPLGASNAKLWTCLAWRMNEERTAEESVRARWTEGGYDVRRAGLPRLGPMTLPWRGTSLEVGREAVVATGFRRPKPAACGAPLATDDGRRAEFCLLSAAGVP